jgi:hypothetical protein
MARLAVGSVILQGQCPVYVGLADAAHLQQLLDMRGIENAAQPAHNGLGGLLSYRLLGHGASSISEACLLGDALE